MPLKLTRRQLGAPLVAAAAAAHASATPQDAAEDLLATARGTLRAAGTRIAAVELDYSVEPAVTFKA